MDFEFSMLNRTDIVLVSGAMSNSLDRYRIVKLQGTPLLLTKLHRVETMTLTMINEAVDQCIKYLKNKPDALHPLLDQYRFSLLSDNRNLSVRNIKQYIDKGKLEPVIVFWSGSTDRDIMRRMGLGGYKMLELIAYDVSNNQEFFLQLKNIKNKEIIVSEGIGNVDKGGSLLNLGETHQLICSKSHVTTHLHDPSTDVALTKCIFDKLLRVMRGKGMNIADYIC